MKLRNVVLAAAICALPLSAFAAGVVKPGKWQSTMEMEITGMPMKMPPMTFTHCITKEDAEKAEGAIPENNQRKNQDCKRTDVSINGNTVTWKVACEKSKMTGEGKVTYTDDSYTGAMQMTSPQGGDTNVKFTGKYLGACEK